MADGLGVSLIPLLDSAESIARFKADPVAFVQEAGGTVSQLDDRELAALKSYLATIQLPEETPGLLQSFSFKCMGCKAGIAFTVVGMSAGIVAVIAFAIGATDGADAPAAPEEAVGGFDLEMASMAAQTGLPQAVVAETTVGVLQSWVTWAAANKAAAVALAASGAAVGEIVGDIAEALCEKAGACN